MQLQPQRGAPFFVDFVSRKQILEHLKKVLTSHTKWSPQSTCVFLSLFQLHAANSDDLAHQKESLPHQVAAAQVLDAKDNHKDDLLWHIK